MTDIYEAADAIIQQRSLLAADVESHKRGLEAMIERRNAAQAKRDTTDMALQIVTAAITDRSGVRDTIASMVSRMVQEVFGSHVSFRFEDVEDDTGNLNGVRPLVCVGGVDYDPMRTGGGMMNTVAFALRMAFVLCLPGRRVLILDEPNVNLDTDKWVGWQSFVETMVNEADVQLFLVTHSGTLIGKALRLEGGHGKVISR